MLENENISKKLTFLLPIKERTFISKRIVKHLSKCDFMLNILIADGSHDSQERIFEPLKLRHNIIYEKFKFDKNIEQFLKKFYYSSTLIKTKYCSLMESDELINFDNYINLINFLENNNGYNFVTGKIINFNIKKDNSIEILKKQCHPNFGDLKNKNFDYYYHPSCWEGVHRTENLTKSFEHIHGMADENIDLLSLAKFFNILTLAQGDAKFLQNETISFRQSNTHHFDKDRSISSNKLLRKQNKIKSLLLLRRLKYNFKLYQVLKNYIKSNNLKLIMIKYYTEAFFFNILSDFLLICKKIFKISKKQNFENTEEQFIINNKIIYGLNFLSEFEKEKLNKYLENFKVDI